MRIFKIKGVVQDYAWGGTSFIPQLLGKPVTGNKAAEYWLGSHKNAPSILENTGEELHKIIEKDPVATLGEKVTRQFGCLPFLFKVLDVQDMLSIQVHPTKREAEKGFRRENDLGIPLSTSNRNYKDDNHKPEIMVALGEFWLLHGFKSAADLTETLRNTPELNHLLDHFIKGGYHHLYKQVMDESQEKTNNNLRPLIQRILPSYERGELDKSTPEFWAARAFNTFCTDTNLDKGIYSIFFFNILKVKEGEAVFQDAGIPHAYLEGQNIELMANSDNVLRGGLTPKHVDVPELLDHINFSETIPKIINGVAGANVAETVYPTPVKDFELSRILLNRDKNYSHTAKNVEITLITEGQAEIFSNEESIEIRRGEAILIPSGTSYQINSGSLVAYKATCPL